MASSRPTLVFVVGPPAVGKMTVGAALAARTGLKLFHNHRTIDLILPFFAFGSPPFNRLVSEFRQRILEEVASSDLLGLIFTYVWAFDQPTDDADVEAYSAIFKTQRRHGLLRRAPGITGSAAFAERDRASSRREAVQEGSRRVTPSVDLPRPLPARFAWPVRWATRLPADRQHRPIAGGRGRQDHSDVRTRKLIGG
jgi:hypothetical protein